MKLRNWLIAGAVLAVIGGLHWASERAVPHSPGVLVASAPEQTSAADTTPVKMGDFTLKPLADFSLSARVLSREDYHFDTESELAPTDLALGWGRMSDSAVLAKLDISQSGRFYHYRWTGSPPIPRAEIVRSSANMHLIPADANVAHAIAQAKVGDIVHLRGELVLATRADGWRWRSSLTRTDSGAGACELVLVRAFRSEP